MSEYCVAMDYNKFKETDESNHATDDEYKIIVDLSAPGENSAVDMTSALTSNSNALSYITATRSFHTIMNDNYSNLKIEPVVTTKDTAKSEIFGGTAVDPDVKSGVQDVALYSMDTKRNNSKLFVIGSADFIDDKNTPDDIIQDNSVVSLYLLSLSWMHDSDVNLFIPNKEAASDYMNVKSEKTANSLIFIFIAVPIVIAGIGVIVWSRRRIS
jgi:hypothetical protein